MIRILTCIALAAVGWLAMPTSARAAESYDNCTGFIDSLPAVIETQGVWCLRQHLATDITSGFAIFIGANNITIDCNDFKLGGLAAGIGTGADGIYSANRLNATVRRCNIRGFFRGVNLAGGGGGHVVEDNRFDGNTHLSLYVRGDGSVVRRNRVSDTGGSTVFPGIALGIQTQDGVDVLDNTVDGVLPAADGSGNGIAFGIRTDGNLSGSINGNRVRGVTRLGTGLARGIVNTNSFRISVRDNDLSGDASTGSVGLHCNNVFGRAKDNIINGFATGIAGCGNDGNVVVP